MMRLAFVYAGQGSQAVGMGKDFYDNEPAFCDAFDCLPQQLQQLCFEGDIAQLSLTQNTQPCMVAFAAGVTALLAERGIVPEVTAGLSLGEYSALQAAGALTAQQAVELVTFRGQQMAEATKGRDCKMAAVLMLDRGKLAECCAKAATHGVVEIANYNCPGQLVIGGETTAVGVACELALEAGARRCVPLAVSGAFHTSLMKPAGDALRERLSTISFGSMRVPVIFNCTAKPLGNRETIAGLLERQVQSSVYFEDTIRYMEQCGIDTVIEIGPGRVLSGFVKKTSKAMRVLAVEDMTSLAETLMQLKGDNR